MLLQRRTFMGMILGAAASGVLLSSAKVAQAIALVPMDRITETVRRGQELRNLAQIMNETAGTRVIWNTPHELMPRYQALMIEYVDFLTDSFPEPPDPQTLSELFNGKLSVDAFDEVKLRTVAEPLVPHAAMVQCIRTDRLPMNAQLPSWNRFAEQHQSAFYASGIIYATRFIRPA